LQHHHQQLADNYRSEMSTWHTVNLYQLCTYVDILIHYTEISY
jgi:hypothetical protein